MNKPSVNCKQTLNFANGKLEKHLFQEIPRQTKKNLTVTCNFLYEEYIFDQALDRERFVSRLQI